MSKKSCTLTRNRGYAIHCDSRFRLRSSAQELSLPGICEICKLISSWNAHWEIHCKKVAVGSLVLNCLLILDSADVLSELAGRQICIWSKWRCWEAAIKSASCARTSKAEMYFCASLVSLGRKCRSCDIENCSLNHTMDLDVIIQPPIPKESCSAKASAAARITPGVGRASGYMCDLRCKMERNQSSFFLVSFVREKFCCIGAQILTHWSLDVFGAIGTSSLSLTIWCPISTTRPP